LSKRNGKKKRPVRYYSPKRRAVYAQGDEINHLVLFEMHGWRCWVCKGTINRHLRFPNFMAATVEHIIPISKGGTHTWDNVAPAHAKCNFEKGDSLADGLRGTLIA